VSRRFLPKSLESILARALFNFMLEPKKEELAIALTQRRVMIKAVFIVDDIL